MRRRRKNPLHASVPAIAAGLGLAYLIYQYVTTSNRSAQASPNITVNLPSVAGGGSGSSGGGSSSSGGSSTVSQVVNVTPSDYTDTSPYDSGGGGSSWDGSSASDSGGDSSFSDVPLY